MKTEALLKRGSVLAIPAGHTETSWFSAARRALPLLLILLVSGGRSAAFETRWAHGIDPPNHISFVSAYFGEYAYDTREHAAEAGCDTYDTSGLDHRPREIYFDEGNQYWAVHCESFRPTTGAWQKSGGFALFEGDPCRYFWSDLPPCCPPGTTFEESSLQCATYDCPRSVTILGLCPIERGKRCVGNPVDPGPGIKLQAEEDLAISGSPFRFRRFYNSHLDYRSTADGLVPAGTGNPVMPFRDYAAWKVSVPAGYVPASGVLSAPSQFDNPRWRSNFDARVGSFSDPHSDGVLVMRPDGEKHNFLHEVANRFRAITDPGATLEWLPDAPGGIQWRYFRSDELIEEFDAGGRLLAIQTRQGHRQMLRYDQSGHLQRVDTSLGKYITFEYGAGGKLATLRDSAGRSWEYRYDQAGNLARVINPDGTTRQYHYEDDNLPHALTGITDERGVRYATYAYDGKGRAVLTTHAGNVDRIDIAYPSSGARVITNSRGESSTYTVQRQGGETLITDVDGPGCASCGSTDASYDYDPVSNDLLAKTENGITTQYGNYDVNGNPGFKIEAAGTPEERRVDYTYDSRFPRRVVSMIEASVFQDAGKITTYSYDEFGNRLSETVAGFRPDGTAVRRSTQYEYAGPLHQLSKIDGPRTDVEDITVFKYYPDDVSAGDDRARLMSVTGPGGIVSRGNIRYTPDGKTKSEERPNGIAVSYTYYPGNDRLELMTESTATGQRVTRWTYLPTGEVESITVGDGTSQASTTQFSYDDARRLIRISDSLGNYLEYTLDTEGNRLAEKIYGSGDVLTKVLTQAFDVYNRLASTHELNQSVQYRYNVNGLINEMTTGNGAITRFDYDGLNRLVKTTRDAGNLDIATVQAFDVADRRVTVADPKGLITKYEVDDLGNRLQEDSPDTGITAYRYDASGNRLEQTDARGVVTHYSYDESNRLLEARYPDTGRNIFYEYDHCPGGVGKLCRMTDESGVTTYTYDGFGNRITETRDTGEERITTGYRYDIAGGLAGITYPSGRQIDYQRDAVGRITKVVATMGENSEILANDVTYLPFGPVQTFTYGNGLRESRAHDSAYRLTGVTIPGLSELVYKHDSEGNISAIDRLSGSASVQIGEGSNVADTADVGELDNGAGMSLGTVSAAGQVFVYDAVNRLVREAGVYGQRSYNYDQNGNRTGRTKTDHVLNEQGESLEITETEQYGYASGTHHLVSIDTMTGGVTVRNSRAYDRVGNTLSGNNGKKGFSYSDRNRLSSYTKNGQLKAEYFYNGHGQRTTKIKYKDDGSTRTIRYFYSQSGKLLAMARYKNGLLKAYKDVVWLEDQPVAQVTTRYKSDQTIKKQTTVYLHTDHLNTPRFATDIEKNVVWRWDADAFGDGGPDTDPDGDGINTFVPLRFPGQIASEGGVFYNYFRDYDPKTGRYIESDPLGIRAGTNPYAYAGSNPTGYVDPKGLIAFLYIPNYTNGNLWGEFNPQNPGCDGLPDSWETPCVKKCCETHDKCYEKYGCNLSSWFSGTPFGSAPCHQCNRDAVKCILSSFGESDKECDSKTCSK